MVSSAAPNALEELSFEWPFKSDQSWQILVASNHAQHLGTERGATSTILGERFKPNRISTKVQGAHLLSRWSEAVGA